MDAVEVLDLYSSLEKEGIAIWIDGGWAVDALIGKQTRSHNDLDIAIDRKDVPAFLNIMQLRGYKEITREEDLMWDLVLKDEEGREVEAHAFTLDGEGKVVKEEYWNGYDEHSLSSNGAIEGQFVRCVSLEQLIKTHDEGKRKFKDTDFADMVALKEKFKF